MDDGDDRERSLLFGAPPDSRPLTVEDLKHPYRFDPVIAPQPKVSWFGRWLCKHSIHRDRFHRFAQDAVIEEREWRDASLSFYIMRGFARCTRCNREVRRYFYTGEKGDQLENKPFGLFGTAWVWK